MAANANDATKHGGFDFYTIRESRELHLVFPALPEDAKFGIDKDSAQVDFFNEILTNYAALKERSVPNQQTLLLRTFPILTLKNNTRHI